MEKLLSLDIRKVDLENLCELPEPVIQPLEAIMEQDSCDGVDEQIENEACLEEEEEQEEGETDDVEDLHLVLEDGSEDSDGPTLDDIMEDEDFAKNSQSLFVESSLNSIRRGQMNNNGKRPASDSSIAGPSKRFNSDNI